MAAATRGARAENRAAGGRTFDPNTMTTPDSRHPFEDDPDDQPQPGPSPRPRDAATLIIVRRDMAEPHVLMGQRHGGHAFMPNKFVFPGGRVDRVDSFIKPATDLRPEVAEKLCRDCGEKKARSLALAAIRETWEETGLAVGQLTDMRQQSRDADWNSYFQLGIAPTLHIMDFVARAITPPYRPRRFDARFFMADAEHIQGDWHDLSGASGELINLHWVSVSEARNLDLPAITQFVIAEIEKRVTGPDHSPPVPFVFYRQGQTEVVHL